MELVNKKVTVIGCRKSGVAAAKLVKQLGGIPFVSDLNNDAKMALFVEELVNNEIQFEVGGHTEKIYDADLIVISPGVPSDSPFIKEALIRGIKVISEIEFGSLHCKGKIIAITGTNGKTTTTSLMGHIIETSGRKSYVAGNIGIKAFCEVALEVGEDEYIVLEISSFQLDFIETFKPKIAMILNITPDHLNRYDNKFENYIASKYRIFMNQENTDYLILNGDDPVFDKFPVTAKSGIKYFSLLKQIEDGICVHENSFRLKLTDTQEFMCNLDELKLPGEHNIANAMATIIAAKIIGITDEDIVKGLNLFKAVEHRIEFVEEIKGVKYYNDSKATNIDSVWYALKSFTEPIYLILGGLDKGNDYNQIKDLIIDRVKKIYAIGSSADKVYDFFNEIIPVEKKESLQDCINSTYIEAKAGEVLLLSPACASFDMFDSYEHRGKVFKEGVRSLKR
ncbi:MAG: UDP-N-acetylmuramoyl-L-alanine--D-glutamate ligase [Ignavibacteriaceae bacterium]